MKILTTGEGKPPVKVGESSYKVFASESVEFDPYGACTVGLGIELENDSDDTISENDLQYFLEFEAFEESLWLAPNPKTYTIEKGELKILILNNDIYTRVLPKDHPIGILRVETAYTKDFMREKRKIF